MNNSCFTFPTAPPGHAIWVGDPSCRGTFGIVSLCLSTTVICIWSSVHRDIPLKYATGFRSIVQKAPLVLIALFSPELLFFFALNQFLCAKRLTKLASKMKHFHVEEAGVDSCHTSKVAHSRELKTSGSQREQPDDRIGLLRNSEQVNLNVDLRGNIFTLIHGFYATMGGFAFRGTIDTDGEIDTKRHAKLNARGVRFLMEHDPSLIPDIPLISITERSKSNGFGKALLVLQVLWFCMNCVSRLAEKLPLSLLELTTVAHGLFTLSSYAMWWHKPLNVDQPTWIPIKTRDAQEVLALMQILSDFTRDGVKNRELFEECLHRHSSAHPGPGVNNRIIMALRAKTRLELVDTASNYRCLSFDVMPKIPDFYGALEVRAGIRGQICECVATACITIVYGSLHYLGRHSRFPTEIEQKLWCLASLIITFIGVLAATLDRIRDALKASHYDGRNGAKIFYSFLDVAYSIIIPFFIYLPCTGFLLFESSRQLLYLQPEGFVDASWSYYIPHWL